MNGWRQRTKEEADGAAHQSMGGVRFATHILAQWVSQAVRHDEPRSELTLFEDGSIQIHGAAPVELLTYVQAAWHNHQKGRPT